jgi:hypothetical protein
MIVKILEVVEFMEALESADGMCAARALSVNQKRFQRDPVKRGAFISAQPLQDALSVRNDLKSVMHRRARKRRKAGAWR